jgi:hypothetical protein
MGGPVLEPARWDSSPLILGRVNERSIRLYAFSGNRNSFRPLLRGRVVRSERPGSRFVGSTGWDPAVRAFSAACIGVVALGFIASVIVEIVNVVTHDWGAARVTLAPMGGTALFVIVGCLIVSVGT